jgi:CHASE2 domain-containing sensor protein
MASPAKKPHVEVIVSTAITFLILGLLSFIFFNTKFLNPIYHSIKDFQSTDIYFSQYKAKAKGYNQDIVLVNIEDADRNQIANSLGELLNHKPTVIGLDVCFFDKKETQTDSILKSVLSSEKIILASQFDYSSGNPEVLKTNDFFEVSNREGFGNFLGDSSATVRYVAPFVAVDNTQYLSFSSKILEIVSSECFETLKLRNNNTEIINYRDEDFIKIHINDISNGRFSRDFFKDKIILMGYMGDYSGRKVLEDLHVTPLNKNIGGISIPDMYGVEIHAHILAMMLEKQYINEMPTWISGLIAVVICALHMYVFIFLFVKNHLWFHVLAKMVQLVSFGILFAVSILIFHFFNVKMEPSLLLIGIILAVDALYFAELLMLFLQKKFGIRTYFHSH